MSEGYPDGIMLCFVQGFSDSEHGFNKNREFNSHVPDSNRREKKRSKRVSLQLDGYVELEPSENKLKKVQELITGKSLKLTSGTRLPEVKRSLSDRFSVILDPSNKKPTKHPLTIRKTWSTGNFAAGAAGGGCGVPRSAPATPLQLEPQPRPKHDKQAIKPLSGSAPSVRVSSLTADDAKEGKQPSKARQKKFQRHFPQVGPEEKVLNYYSCALVGDLLLQGHLYITKNYFAFYSNVFGYVTKLLIPTTSVLRITKEKVARIIPNAVGVCTRDERHVFGSLLSRDATYKLMTHVWKSARGPELLPNESQELRASEAELDASEYSPEDDSSSAGGDRLDPPEPTLRRESEAIIASGAAVIQPALLTGSSGPKRRPVHWDTLLIFLIVLLTFSALWLSYKLYVSRLQPTEAAWRLSGAQLYAEAARGRARLHARAAADLRSFLDANLLLLAKVRQSLEALSVVLLADMSQNAGQINVPADPVFS